MALQKFPSRDAPSCSMKASGLLSKVHESNQLEDLEASPSKEPDVDIDLREVYFLIMHFLSAGPCQRTCVQFWNELLEHQLLPRRYRAWYSRNGMHSGDENDDGKSLPLDYNMLVQRYPHVENDHLLKLLKQLVLSTALPSRGMGGGNAPNAADVPTLLGHGSFSLLTYKGEQENNKMKSPPAYMRWPHMKAHQVHGLGLREIGGGFTRHHRAPSIRAASYAIAKPCSMFQKIQNTKKIRGHRNAVYCATLDGSGRYVITGSDDRLVKIWLMETAFCLASCRGHEGDITDLAVSSNNALVASSSNDTMIRVWRLPDGLPISVLRGHTGAVTAITFNPRPGSIYHLLSSSDDGTCRIWDARNSQVTPRIYISRPSDTLVERNSGPSSSTVTKGHQIFCCAFNANGTVFVTGSSDTLARVWTASKPGSDETDQPNHEIDVLSGHENDVNYVQFSGCAVISRFMATDTSKEENIPKFKNSWFNNDNIVTCSRDGSAIIWIPRSRRSHGKAGRWVRAYHLKVPPPPMPPQPPRGGPRQRILPTPRGVNMITWSLDNRFVLAAIMDHRICVWNASDGSLVHSLTGHTDSTYVLDVHPFNPRVAMSAGYDGKTIVWDIWEGIPIRVFETSKYRLVDGKFSPDGTSIILSDDVGQLYILDSGQGESHNDAKYDQFFLGDYRPVMHDNFGNVLDQETQLLAYRRNMQDLLCDSVMIPYPEPYQTAYQQRRLGALGSEWHPSSLRLAVGPDFSLDPEYQMMPLADLDIVIEPLPEFVDAMDWEPEIGIQSDDADSEYNLTEDDCSGGEQGSLSSNRSTDPECSEEDSEAEDAEIDRLRRSKRKKQKADIEVVTSSGRSVKRRNLDEYDGNPFRSRRRKSRPGRSTSRKKGSTSKSSRPQRAAARNALSLFSKITGKSADGEDEYESEGDMSGSESTLQDSNIESDVSDRQNQQRKHSKGKEVQLEESEGMVKPPELPEINSGNRKRLVLKLPRRESNKLVSHQDGLISQSCRVLQEATENKNTIRTQDLSSSRGDEYPSVFETAVSGQLHKVENNLDLSEKYKNAISWGGSRMRTSKRLRSGESMSLDALAIAGATLADDKKDYGKPENDFGAMSPHSLTKGYGDKMDTVAKVNEEAPGASTSEDINGEANVKAQSCFSECKDQDQLPNSVHMATWDAGTSNCLVTDRTVKPVSTKLRFRRISRDPSPCKQERNSVVENLEKGRCDTLLESLSSMEQDTVVPENGDTHKSIPCYDGGSREIDNQLDNNVVSCIHESVESHLNKNKMFSAVYRRVRPRRGKLNSEGDSGLKGEGCSYASNTSNHEVDFHDDSIDEGPRTRSMGLKVPACDPSSVDHDNKLGKGPEQGYTYRSTENGSVDKFQLRNEEGGSSSRTTVGLRSTRNRRSNYRDMTGMDKRKSYQSPRKVSWLMLSTHEETRYIPQLGDEVVYLRQGHQEYFDLGGLRETPPWKFIKGRIRAVEFCQVQDLEYSSLAGSGDSCCKLTLQFVDPPSDVYGKSFKMTLPEVTGVPDFIVERTRYVSSIDRKWSCRDHCKVWWKDDCEDDGRWWDGRVKSIQPKCSEFPDSPWEIYTIQYKSDPSDTQLHSPWELFDFVDSEWEQPGIDDKSKKKLHSAFAKLERSASSRQDTYGVDKLKQLQQKPKFTNWCAVPISLEVIQSRLENNYYRSLEALKHDFHVMLLNAETYLESSAVKRTSDKELFAKLKCLSEWFAQAISSL